VNGALTRTTAASFPGNNDTSVLELGKGDVFGNNDVDEVALYGTALSNAQVTAHFAAGQ
jgi:hypothetical protein